MQRQYCEFFMMLLAFLSTRRFVNKSGERDVMESSCQKNAVFIHQLAMMVKPLYLDAHDRTIRVDIELLNPNSHRPYTTIGET